MIIPVQSNVLIKALPVLDSDGDEVDILAQTHRRGEILAIWSACDIPLQIGDIVLMNKSNYFLPLGEEVLVHSSAIFAIEKNDSVIDGETVE